MTVKTKTTTATATLRRSARVKAAVPEPVAEKPAKVVAKATTKATVKKPKAKAVEEPKEPKDESADEPEESKPVKAKESKRKAAEKPKDEDEDETAAKKPRTELTVGDALPAIVLKDQDGVDVDLAKVAADKTVVIFAYPRASTPGCTKQACGFRDLYPKFDSHKVAVFGLSADSVKAQKNFQTKQNLPYQLLSDEKYELIAALGAKKNPKGIVRSHWIVKDGKLVVAELGVQATLSFTKALKEVEGM
ncbi:thioredoxin-like protein [Dipodascopsis tothii]|uniref:thioredoxin-like protein n=1 Tax=Dipodascopsis tothii TaxID=44089 RepID=UPI0034CF2FC8